MRTNDLTRDTPVPEWATDFSTDRFADYQALEDGVTDHLAATSGGAGETTWAVGTYVDGKDAGSINAYAREELANGAEALLFRLYDRPGPAELDAILDGLDPGDFQIHCSLRYAGQDPAELFRDLIGTLRRKGISFERIRGSVDFDPLLDWSEPPFPPLIRLLYFVSRWMPGFRVLQVNAAGFNDGAGEADTELALALAKGEAYLREIQARGYPAALAARHVQFAFSLGTTPAADAAKLRAFATLWERTCEGLDIAPTQPYVSAHTDVRLAEQDGGISEETLLQQAYAARLGGADTVFLAPVDAPDASPTDASRRRALATQQRAAGIADHDGLKAGIHALADALAARAWSRYEQLAEQGGFVGAEAL